MREVIKVALCGLMPDHIDADNLGTPTKAPKALGFFDDWHVTEQNGGLVFRKENRGFFTRRKLYEFGSKWFPEDVHPRSWFDVEERD